MASVEKYKGKHTTTYRITVFHEGRCYRSRYKPEPGMTEKQADKAAERAAYDYEQKIKGGYTVNCQYTVKEWISYVLATKKIAERKDNTIESYRFVASKLPESFLQRKILSIRPSDIQEVLVMLRNLPSQQETRAVKRKNVDLWLILKERRYTKARLQKEAHIAASTLDNIFAGKKVLKSSADKVAAVLHVASFELFDMLEDSHPVSANTMRIYKCFLTMLFGVAVRELLIPYNPASMLEPVRSKRSTRKKTNTLDFEEVQAVLSAIEKEPLNTQCLVHMLLVTGCRRGEVAGMKWENIDWKESTILIDGAILYNKERGPYEDTTKTYDEKLIRLPHETLELLAEYKRWLLARDKYTSNYIFTSRNNGIINPSTIYGILHRLEEKHKLPKINPHRFRHTMASLLIYAGSDIVSVSKRLGHANVSTTQNIYGHMLRKADVESAEHIADIIFRGKKSPK